MLNSRGIVAGLEEAISAVEPIVAVVLIHLYGTRKIYGGTVVVGLFDAAHGAQVEDIRYVRIQTDGLRAVGKGSLIVFKMIFGEAAQIPCLIHIGLQRHYALEDLHGNNVVAHV